MEIIRHQPSRKSRNTWRKMHWKSRLQNKLWQMPMSSWTSNQGQRSPPTLGLFMNLPITAGAAWALQPLLSSSHFFQEQRYAGLIVLHWSQEDASKAKSYATLWRVVQVIPAGLRPVCRSSKTAVSPLGTVGYTHQHWDKLPQLHLHPAFAFGCLTVLMGSPQAPARTWSHRPLQGSVPQSGLFFQAFSGGLVLPCLPFSSKG